MKLPLKIILLCVIFLGGLLFWLAKQKMPAKQEEKTQISNIAIAAQQNATNQVATTSTAYIGMNVQATSAMSAPQQTNFKLVPIFKPLVAENKR